MRRASAIVAVLVLGGCAKYVPVETPKLALPAECKARHFADLPPVDEVPGENISPEALNKHWAKEYRLKQRKAYRRLYRNYRVCSKYASGV